MKLIAACAMCFGSADGAAGAGVRAAVFTLVGVVSIVLAGFAVALVKFLRRA